MAFLKSIGAVGPGTSTEPNATDQFDAMTILLNFLTKVTTPTTGTITHAWVVLKDDSATVPGERHVYLKGLGLSGTDAIFVNIRVYSDIPTDSRNWEIRGATGFNDLSDFNSQPGISTVRSYLTLNDDVAMPFWIVATERRFICIFKIVTTYSACHCGWYLPYATPTQFPYPMYNGGSTYRDDIAWNTTNYTVGNFYDGPVTSDGDSVAQLRHRDGTWLSAASYNSTTGATRPTNSDSNVECYTTMYDENISSSGNFEQEVVDNADGSYPLIPVTLWSPQNSGNVYGEIEGVFWTASRNNTAESIITVSADSYLVVQNMYRTSEANMALKLV